jgi:hypothetical protein
MRCPKAPAKHALHERSSPRLVRVWEIERYRGIHYSAVSKASERLREKMISDKGLSELIDELDSQFKA